MAQLATTRNLPPITRILIAEARINDHDSNPEAYVTLELRTGATDFIVSTKTITVRNGSCDRVFFNSGAPPGTRIEEALGYEGGALDLPAGYTDGLAAWRSGATKQARHDALLAWMRSVEIIDDNLALVGE